MKKFSLLSFMMFILSGLTGCATQGGSSYGFYDELVAPFSSSGGGYGGSYDTAEISSEIKYGSRRFTGNEFNESWDVDISVLVESSGTALGYQFSTLNLWGDERYAVASDSWLNTNFEGWPEDFEVEARYSPGFGNYGTVRVKVTCDDFGHPNYGDTLYEAQHTLTWE